MNAASEITAHCVTSVDEYKNRDRVAEAIQQAREDGARMAQYTIAQRIGKSTDWRVMSSVIAEFNPADVRKVAP